MHAEFAALADEREQRVVGPGRQSGEQFAVVGAQVPSGQDGAGDDGVAEGVGMDAVFRERERRVVGAALRECGGHGAVDVDHGPAAGALREQPSGVTGENLIVAREWRGIRIQPGGQDLGGDGQRIEDGRREENDRGAGGDDRGVQPVDALAKRGEAIFGEGKINAVVHAVAGDDEVGLGLRQHAAETFAEIGAGKFSAGVTGFGEAGNGFAGKPEVDDLAAPIGGAGVDHGLDEVHIRPAEGDAVPEEQNAPGGVDGRRQRCGGSGKRCRREDTEGEEEQQKAHGWKGRKANRGRAG